jgi:nicotinamide-nucleotide amidase
MTPFPAQLVEAAAALLDDYRARSLKLALAESCTGGLVAGCLTEIAGSSDVVERGVVAYSNAAKSELLGVPAELIAAHGAVSEEVARAMAEGALARSRADIALSVTGVAGPGGGSTAKPVGLVHFAIACRDQPTTAHSETFTGDRPTIRLAAVARALALLSGALED